LLNQIDLSRFSEANHFDDALLYYSKAIEANAMYVEAYCNMGVIYKNTGRLEEAVVYYEKALALNPNFTIARTNMAIALTDLGTKMKSEGNVKVTFHFASNSCLLSSFS
jgi:protein O-GlcNAc transferase